MKDDNSIQKAYIEASIIHGEASQKGNSIRANRAYKKLTKIYRLLEEDKDLANTILEALFQYENNSVQCWAAAHALGLNIFINKALEILEKISEQKGTSAIGLNAKYTIIEWNKKGYLHF